MRQQWAQGATIKAQWQSVFISHNVNLSNYESPDSSIAIKPISDLKLELLQTPSMHQAHGKNEKKHSGHKITAAMYDREVKDREVQEFMSA